MSQPQAGIIPEPNQNALFLILRVRDPATNGPAVARVAAGVPALVSRVVIGEDGEELQIVRHSFPYGTVSEAGSFFITYSKSLDIPEKMLSRMMGTVGDRLHDHLMDYTQAVSGATFFAPSLEVLRSLRSRR
ncbi:MAG: Dyp-type peroxidase [Deltaproteobacteria bacterium]|nr:Dyp-type peroxidase [Deltaproteobacteria bacterium]